MVSGETPTESMISITFCTLLLFFIRPQAINKVVNVNLMEKYRDKLNYKKKKKIKVTGLDASFFLGFVPECAWLGPIYLSQRRVTMVTTKQLYLVYLEHEYTS